MDNSRASDLIRDEQHLASLCGALNDRFELAPTEASLVRACEPCDAGLLEQLRAETVGGGDPLGDAFSRIRSGEARRDLGQFYTPDHIVASMTAWVLGHAPVRVIDPGCGSGRYALALRRAGYAGQIIASDVDPLATLMVKAGASVLDADLDVRLESFLDLDLEPVDGVTAFVGNPPYLRHHSLGADAKQWAKQAGGRLGVKVSGLAGLHALFFVKVAELSVVGDVCSFITSSEWFDTKYGSVVRELLAGRLGLERIDAVDQKATTFGDALTTAVVTCSVAGRSEADAQVRIVTDPSQLSALTGGVAVGRKALATSSAWSALLSGSLSEDDGMVPLGTYFKVKRGIATGNNKFFIRTAEEAGRLGLSAYARPCVSRSSELGASGGQLRAKGLKKVLLALPDHLDDPAVAALVAAGERDGAHKGFICSSRKPWWSIPVPDEPAVFAVYMARQPPRFVKNTDKVTHSNVVHALYPQPGVTSDDVDLLLGWLAANADTLTAGRTYHGGLNKWEPSEMMALRVPTLETLRGQGGRAAA